MPRPRLQRAATARREKVQLRIREQSATVGDTVKRGGGGGKVIQNKRRAKNDVEPRVHWTLNTAHQFIIIDHLHQDT